MTGRAPGSLCGRESEWVMPARSFEGNGLLRGICGQQTLASNSSAYSQLCLLFRTENGDHTIPRNYTALHVPRPRIPCRLCPTISNSAPCFDVPFSNRSSKPAQFEYGSQRWPVATPVELRRLRACNHNNQTPRS
jgi:hypothetical protein